MPIYEYECKFCSHRFQVLQKFSDPPPSVCPHCHKQGGIHKVVSPTSFVLKGSGWYVTDYKNNNRSESSPPQSTDKKNQGTGSTGTKNEQKEVEKG